MDVCCFTVSFEEKVFSAWQACYCVKKWLQLKFFA